MPIPEGGDVDLEQTLVFGGGNNWFGRLVITTSFGPNEMFDFYANQLPSFGWDVITTLRSTVSVLNVRARRSRRDHPDPEADDSRRRGDRDRLAPRRVPDAHGGAGDGSAGAAQPVSGARARRPAPAQPAPMMVGFAVLTPAFQAAAQGLRGGVAFQRPGLQPEEHALAGTQVDPRDLVGEIAQVLAVSAAQLRPSPVRRLLRGDRTPGGSPGSAPTARPPEPARPDPGWGLSATDVRIRGSGCIDRSMAVRSRVYSSVPISASWFNTSSRRTASVAAINPCGGAPGFATTEGAAGISASRIMARSAPCWEIVMARISRRAADRTEPAGNLFGAGDRAVQPRRRRVAK